MADPSSVLWNPEDSSPPVCRVISAADPPSGAGTNSISGSSAWTVDTHAFGSGLPARSLQSRPLTAAFSPPLNGTTAGGDGGDLECESPTKLQSPSSPIFAILPARAPIDYHSHLYHYTAPAPGPAAAEPRRDSTGPALFTSLPGLSLNRKASSSSLQPTRTPSLKATAFANNFGTASGASSVVPSPIISAMGDITPLPSPMLPGGSPGPWRMLSGRQRSVDQMASPASAQTADAVDFSSSTVAYAGVSRRKPYGDLPPPPPPITSGEIGTVPQSGPDGGKAHGRNRSASDYVPDQIGGIPKRHVTISVSHKIRAGDAAGAAQSHLEPHMRREAHLAETRGITAIAITQPPTPPPSVSSRDSSETPSSSGTTTTTTAVAGRSSGAGLLRRAPPEYFEAHCRPDGKRRRWRSVRQLGEGTFSRVVLATSLATVDDYGTSGPLPPSRSLVAVKVCEHGPKGGASEERVEMSLKRELEIMRTIHHPSLVHLKAWNIEPTRAILILSYCPGGDLFDVATTHRHVLRAPLIRRMFSEMVGAVRYLHGQKIVHRDIKLENVLCNLTPAQLVDGSIDWTTYPFSVITLTDLGLSRRIADNEKLETRCGSDDYAAPEVIMGQPYDGRATDGWSLGVLLYALLEARLPFDPNPNVSDAAAAHRMRSRTSHRIARVEWRWIEYGGGEDGEDHEASEARFREKGLVGAMEITEGLLRRARSRLPLEKVAETEWVRGGIAVDGGLKYRDEDEGEEV